MSELEDVRKYLKRKIGKKGYILLVQTTSGCDDIDLITNIAKRSVTTALKQVIKNARNQGF